MRIFTTPIREYTSDRTRPDIADRIWFTPLFEGSMEIGNLWGRRFKTKCPRMDKMSLRMDKLSSGQHAHSVDPVSTGLLVPEGTEPP
jgi:hypothetical protein